MSKPQRRDRHNNRQQEPKEFEESVIQLDRVTRVVKGGRRMRFRATIALGNRKGKVGIGIGKSAEVVGAIKKAVADAKKNMIMIPLNNDTIPHRVNSKFKASKILLIPAGAGTGIIAGGATRTIIELSGIKNILSKTLGSSNRVNNSQATIEALRKLRPRKQKEFKDENATTTVTPGEAGTEAPKAEAKKPAHKPTNAQKAPAKKPAPKK